MRLVDDVLENEQLLDTVYEAQGERCPQSRSRARDVSQAGEIETAQIHLEQGCEDRGNTREAGNPLLGDPPQNGYRVCE